MLNYIELSSFSLSFSVTLSNNASSAGGPSNFTLPEDAALQMKGWWKSNINVWFPIMDFQKWNCYFPNRIIMFCLPVPTLLYLWEIYILPGLVCLFCCREICGLILEIYKLLTDTWMWKLGLRPLISQKRNTWMGFSLQCEIEPRRDAE